MDRCMDGQTYEQMYGCTQRIYRTSAPLGADGQKGA
jgi:hypothetical protein